MFVGNSCYSLKCSIIGAFPLVLISHNNNAVTSIATVTNVSVSSASIQCSLDSGMTFMTLDVTVSGMCESRIAFLYRLLMRCQ